MRRDRFKYEIATAVSLAFKQAFPGLHSEVEFIYDVQWIYDHLEVPKNPEWGNYALPLFELAKALKKNPPEINKTLSGAENEIASQKPEFSHLSFNPVGGFNNVRIKTEVLADTVLDLISHQHEDYGSSDIGNSGKIVIDFSSPNIAKPFGVGHLRTTAIGHSLYRIFQYLGYEPIGINHLGDWGTQFGKLIVAFKKWSDEDELRQDPIMKLLDLYVKFHREEETDPSLSEQAREAFRRLESGKPLENELWNKFKEYSLLSFKKTYKRLGIHFDYYTGESFYNDKMEETIERLKKAGLTKISQGALIVDLEKYNLPPCILRKADGATLYATRDITGVLYRWNKFQFTKALYVVATAQKVHFQQVFKVIELLEQAENIPVKKRCAHRLVHVDFGWIKFKDEMMSTRRGNIIFLDDVLDKATELARNKIIEKNPDLEEIELTAHQIGIGAVLFADMSTRRQKDVNFDWDEVLNFEGETGPYLQYTHARLSSLLRLYGRPVADKIETVYLDKPEEHRVLDLIYKFPAVIAEAADNYEPYILGRYLIDLASAFNKIYQRKDQKGRIDKIISDDRSQSDARMALVHAVKIVIKRGLFLLGIEAPEKM